MTAMTPATSVIKIRLYGNNGTGLVSTLPRGSIIATEAGFPQGYRSKFHEPLLIGIPDGWALNTEEQDAYEKLLAAGSNFVPVVLAEEVTVRRKFGSLYADTYVSAVISGVSELVGKWADFATSYGGFSPSQLFPAGSQIFCIKTVDGAGRQHIQLCASPDVRVERGSLGGNYAHTCPIGEFLFPALTLPVDKPGYYSNVYIDTLTSKSLRQMRSSGVVAGGVGRYVFRSYNPLVWKNPGDLISSKPFTYGYRNFDNPYGAADLPPGKTNEEAYIWQYERVQPILEEMFANPTTSALTKADIEAALIVIEDFLSKRDTLTLVEIADARGGEIIDKALGKVDYSSLASETTLINFRDKGYWADVPILPEARELLFDRSVAVPLKRVVVKDAGGAGVPFSHGPKQTRNDGRGTALA